MRKLSILILITIITGIAAAQDKELWPKWDKGKVNKMLNSSPWAQTQTDTDTSQMTYSPTTNTGTSSIGRSTSSTAGGGATNVGREVQGDRSDSGASNQAMSVNYHVRFLSAKPIRQALARMIEIRTRTIKEFANSLVLSSSAISATTSLFQLCLMRPTTELPDQCSRRLAVPPLVH